MSYREFRDNADLLYAKEKQVLQIALDKYCKKFEEKNIKFDYRFYSKRNKKTHKIDFELVCELYPLYCNKNKSIKEYEYRSYKFVMFSYSETNRNIIYVSKWSNRLLNFILVCQLYLLGNCKLTKENVFDFIFKLFFNKNMFRYQNCFRGKSIELIRFIVIDVLPLLFVSILIISFIMNNPNASFWSLVG